MTSGEAHQRAQARFQSGLLAWLRAPEQAEGLREMVAVTRELVAAADDGGERVLWRSAESFLAALLEGTLVADDEARRLARRIERRLAALARGEPDAGGSDSAAALRDALFAWVSRRAAANGGNGGAPNASANGSATATTPASASGAAGLLPALAATAELLPLIAGARAMRCSEAQLHAWNTAARRLDTAWAAVFRDGLDACRVAATDLLGVALDIDDPGGLRLAEALATAIGCAEDEEWRAAPTLRAAIAGALELAIDARGPNLPSFASRASDLAARLERVEDALREARRSGTVRPGVDAFAGEGRRRLGGLRPLLAETPLPRAALDAELAWFAAQSCGNSMAVRGLIVLWREVLQSATDDAALAAAGVLAARALGAAIDDLAIGRAPHPDIETFAALRALRRKLA